MSHEEKRTVMEDSAVRAECSSCKVKVRGSKKTCPLCGLPLRVFGVEQPVNGQHTDFFPRIPPRISRTAAWRWLLFASITAIVIAFAIDNIYPTRVDWFRLMLLSVGTMWVVFLTVLRKRHNLSKSIVWQLTLLSLLALIWDRITGWRGWSVNIAVPLIILGAQLAMFILSRVMKLEPGDYIVYFVLAAIMGIVPAVFILTELITFTLLAVIAVIVSIIFLSYIVIFRWSVLRDELAKRMHL